MPIATELLERASDSRGQAMRVRTLCRSLTVDGGQADLESYALKLEQKAADLERLASSLVGASTVMAIGARSRACGAWGAAVVNQVQERHRA